MVDTLSAFDDLRYGLAGISGKLKLRKLRKKVVKHFANFAATQGFLSKPKTIDNMIDFMKSEYNLADQHILNVLKKTNTNFPKQQSSANNSEGQETNNNTRESLYDFGLKDTLLEQVKLYEDAFSQIDRDAVLNKEQVNAILLSIARQAAKYYNTTNNRGNDQNQSSSSEDEESSKTSKQNINQIISRAATRFNIDKQLFVNLKKYRNFNNDVSNIRIPDGEKIPNVPEIVGTWIMLMNEKENPVEFIDEIAQQTLSDENFLRNLFLTNRQNITGGTESIEISKDSLSIHQNKQILGAFLYTAFKDER